MVLSTPLRMASCRRSTRVSGRASARPRCAPRHTVTSAACVTALPSRCAPPRRGSVARRESATEATTRWRGSRLAAAPPAASSAAAEDRIVAPWRLPPARGAATAKTGVRQPYVPARAPAPRNQQRPQRARGSGATRCLAWPPRRGSAAGPRRGAAQQRRTRTAGPAVRVNHGGDGGRAAQREGALARDAGPRGSVQRASSTRRRGARARCGGATRAAACGATDGRAASRRAPPRRARSSVESGARPKAARSSLAAALSARTPPPTARLRRARGFASGASADP